MRRVLWVSVIGVLLGSCVSYDFEPVTPLALSTATKHYTVSGTLPPNVMLVIDKSGSMDLPIDPNNSACGSCGSSKTNLCNTISCPTRWSTLQSAVTSVIPNVQNLVRFGLTTFPADAVCGAPGSERQALPNSDDPTTLTTNGQQVSAIIQGIVSNGVAGTPNATGGGTPTGAALRILETDSQLVPKAGERRQSIAILLTDGLPNCNANNPNDWNVNPAACQCTLADCSGYPKLGCLDEDATVAEIQKLSSLGVQVAVVGFGAEATSGPAPTVLKAMAQAGGFARACMTSANCAAGDSCNGGVCSTGLFLPTNGTELADALEQIAHPGNPCQFTVSAGADPNLVEVEFDGQPINRADWTLSGTDLTVTGASCDRLVASTPSSKIAVDLRDVQPVP